MPTMNISLPDPLKTHVDEQLAGRGYGTGSEYMRKLIRKDQDRQRLRALLLEGAESEPAAVADAAYFGRLRARSNGYLRLTVRRVIARRRAEQDIDEIGDDSRH